MLAWSHWVSIPCCLNRYVAVEANKLKVKIRDFFTCAWYAGLFQGSLWAAILTKTNTARTGADIPMVTVRKSSEPKF